MSSSLVPISPSRTLNGLKQHLVRPDDLLPYLDQYKPQIVLFSGHWSPTEEIVLLDPHGNAKGGIASGNRLFVPGAQTRHPTGSVECLLFSNARSL
jgi:hypothetical protein